jgi:putative Mn2+ efflux pump MntP
MDAFAVTLTNLIAYPRLSRARRLALPIIFGVFQALMPLIGYFAGSLALDYISAFAGPLALVILSAIGGKMVYEAIKGMRQQRKEKALAGAATAEEEKALAEAGATTTTAATIDATAGEEKASAEEATAKDEEAPKAAAPAEKAGTLSLPVMLLQGVATSIDALIVGVSLVALGANIFVASPLIGVTTFLVCLVGLAIGRRVGILLGDRAQLVGGIILILIGIRACFF